MEEGERLEQLEEKIRTCQLRDRAELGKDMPPVQFRIVSRVNDPTQQEKLSLHQMAGARGYSQRPEYTIPVS